MTFVARGLRVLRNLEHRGARMASNAIGLLHRVSRVMSGHGCNVDLVLISTEGARAIDVFHLTRDGAKLTAAAGAALTADLQRTLERHDEAD